MTCIEAGALEAEVLLLAESLRAFGGEWANVDFIAAKPRFGPSISAHTRSEMKRLRIEFVEGRFNKDYAWWNNANKSSVMAFLETRVGTPNITWMDGDMAILKPLDDLAPAEGTQFRSRSGEGYLGSDGSDSNAPYWRALCDMLGIDFDAFPEIVSWPEQRPIRAYWQTGVYSYATDTRLGAEHYNVIGKLLSSSIGSKQAGIYHQDQVSIALAVQKLGLKHSQFDPRMNYNVNPIEKDKVDRLPLDEVKILHYHGSMYDNHYGWFAGVVDRLAPDRAEMMRRHAPLSLGGYGVRLQKRLLARLRQPKVDAFKQRAVLY